MRAIQTQEYFERNSYCSEIKINFSKRYSVNLTLNIINLVSPYPLLFIVLNCYEISPYSFLPVNTIYFGTIMFSLTAKPIHSLEPDAICQTQHNFAFLTFPENLELHEIFTYFHNGYLLMASKTDIETSKKTLLQKKR